MDYPVETEQKWRPALTQRGFQKTFTTSKAELFHWTARKVMSVPSGFENGSRCGQVIIHEDLSLKSRIKVWKKIH